MHHHYLVNQAIVKGPQVQMDELYWTWLDEIGLPKLPTAGDTTLAEVRRELFMKCLGDTQPKFLSWLETKGFEIIEPVQIIRIFDKRT